MGKIYNLFSDQESPPTTHSVESANQLLPLVQKFTSEAVKSTARLTYQMEGLKKDSPEFAKLSEEFDQIIDRWVERIHRVGAVAKGLWLVDFDTGSGFLCWCYPESRVEHFHPYDSGYKKRKKISP
jgi:hypothetical protein